MAAKPEYTLIIEKTRGPVTVEQRPDLEPNHVARIKELACQGFYHGGGVSPRHRRLHGPDR